MDEPGRPGPGHVFFLFAAQNRRKVSAQEYDPFPRGKAVPSLPRLLASIFTVHRLPPFATYFVHQGLSGF